MRFSPSRRAMPRSTFVRASLPILALVFIVGFYEFSPRFAGAAQLSMVSDVISTSKPGLGADHTIRFTTPSGISDDGSTLVISIPNGFSMASIGEDDIDIADDGVDLSTGPACGVVEAAISTSTQSITIEFCTGAGGAIAPLSVVTIEIGQHASVSGIGVNRIVNHVTPGSYEVGLSGTIADEGYTQIAIVDAVVVTGIVETYLDFTVSGVDADENINGDLTPTSGTSTATTVPFGVLQPNIEYLIGQDLAVTTNAVTGFSVTVEAATDLESTIGATIDSFVDGSGTSTPVVWAGPSGQVGSAHTFGHWGLTTEDVSLSDNDSFGTALYVGDFIQEPREVFHATTSADGVTDHIGRTRVGYKVQITDMQEAARDYQTELTYVVTPLF